MKSEIHLTLIKTMLNNLKSTVFVPKVSLSFFLIILFLFVGNCFCEGQVSQKDNFYSIERLNKAAE